MPRPETCFVPTTPWRFDAARIAGNARHTGQSRRGFLASLCGAATTLLTLNEAFAWSGKRGGFFDLPREAAFEPAVVPTPVGRVHPEWSGPSPGAASRGTTGAPRPAKPGGRGAGAQGGAPGSRRRAPHWHYIGEVLLASASRLPLALREVVGDLARISPDLRQDREAAFSGDEAAGRAPDEIDDEADARRAQGDASFVVERVGRALGPSHP